MRYSLSTCTTCTDNLQRCYINTVSVRPVEPISTITTDHQRHEKPFPLIHRATSGVIATAVRPQGSQGYGITEIVSAREEGGRCTWVIARNKLP